jgi:hypothetical protein
VIVTVVMILSMVVIDRCRFRVSDARELKGVIDPVLSVDHAMRLQGDHDDHPETGAYETSKVRHDKSPIFAA